MNNAEKNFITNCNGVTVEFCKDIIQSGNVSLKAIGLYFSILWGDLDIDIENPEYKEALMELFGKNFFEFKLRKK